LPQSNNRKLLSKSPFSYFKGIVNKAFVFGKSLYIGIDKVMEKVPQETKVAFISYFDQLQKLVFDQTFSKSLFWLSFS